MPAAALRRSHFLTAALRRSHFLTDLLLHPTSKWISGSGILFKSSQIEAVIHSALTPLPTSHPCAPMRTRALAGVEKLITVTSSDPNLPLSSQCAQSGPCFSTALFSMIHPASRGQREFASCCPISPANSCCGITRGLSSWSSWPSSPAAPWWSTSSRFSARGFSTSSCPPAATPGRKVSQLSKVTRPPPVTQVCFDNDSDISKEEWLSAKVFLKGVSVLRSANTNRLNQQLSGTASNMYHLSTAGSCLGDSLNMICLANSNRGYCIKQYLTSDNLLIAPRLCAFRLRYLNMADVHPENDNYRAAGSAFFDLLKESEPDHALENLSPAVKDLFNKWDKVTDERLIINHPTLLSYHGKAAFIQRLHLMLNKSSRMMNWTSANMTLKSFSYAAGLNVFEKINSSPILVHIHENRMVAKSSVVPTLQPATDSSNSQSSLQPDPAALSSDLSNNNQSLVVSAIQPDPAALSSDLSDNNQCLVVQALESDPAARSSDSSDNKVVPALQPDAEEETEEAEKTETEKKRQGYVLVSLHRHCTQHWCDHDVKNIKDSNGHALWPFTEDDIIDLLDTVFPTFLLEAQELLLRTDAATHWRVLGVNNFWPRDLLRFGGVPIPKK